LAKSRRIQCEQEQEAGRGVAEASEAAAATGKVCIANNEHFWHTPYAHPTPYILHPATYALHHLHTGCSLEWQIKQFPTSPDEYVYASWHCNNFINMQCRTADRSS